MTLTADVTHWFYLKLVYGIFTFYSYLNMCMLSQLCMYPKYLPWSKRFYKSLKCLLKVTFYWPKTIILNTADSANIDLTGWSTPLLRNTHTHDLVYPSFFSSSMGFTFGARHVGLLLQITRSKVENKSENSYIRHYLRQQLSSDTDKALWQVATQRGQLQLFCVLHRSVEVWIRTDWVRWDKIKKKKGDHQQRYSINSLGKEGSRHYHLPTLSGEIIQRELLDENV